MNALEQLTKISLPKKLIVLCVLLALFAVGYWIVYYNPLTEELSKLERTHASLIKKRKDAERRKKTYEMDLKKLDEYRKIHKEQLRALPQDTEMSSFLNNLNAQGELVGLDILSVKPLKEETAKYYARVPVRLRLKGTFHQLAKFFYLVGNLERIINIEDISLNRSGLTDSAAILNAEVLATTFRALKPGGEKRGRKRKR